MDDRVDVPSDLSKSALVVKLSFQSNPNGNGLSLVDSVTLEGATLPEHLSADELEMLLLNRASKSSTERAEEHLRVCGRCQDAAIVTEIELASLRRALLQSLDTQR
jgi:hypothetical protein